MTEMNEDKEKCFAPIQNHFKGDNQKVGFEVFWKARPIWEFLLPSVGSDLDTEFLEENQGCWDVNQMFR